MEDVWLYIGSGLERLEKFISPRTNLVSAGQAPTLRRKEKKNKRFCYRGKREAQRFYNMVRSLKAKSEPLMDTN